MSNIFNRQLNIVNAPPRPSFGTNGVKSSLLANYFRLQVALKHCWRYAIEVNPKTADKGQVEPTGVKLKVLVKKALGRLVPANKHYASDLKSYVATIDRLQALTCDVAVDNEWSKLYKFTLSEPKKINIDQVLNSLSDMCKNWKNSSCETENPVGAYTGPIDTLDTIGLILSHNTVNKNPGITQVGRSRFFDTGTKGSPRQLFKEPTLQIVRGFSQSVRPADEQFLLNVNAVNAVFVPRISLKELICKSQWFMSDKEDMDALQLLGTRLTGVRIEYNVGKKTVFKTIKGLGRTINGEKPAQIYPKDVNFTLTARKDQNGKAINMSTKLREIFNKMSEKAGGYKISVKDYFKNRKFTTSLFQYLER